MAGSLLATGYLNAISVQLMTILATTATVHQKLNQNFPTKNASKSFGHVLSVDSLFSKCAHDLYSIELKLCAMHAISSSDGAEYHRTQMLLFFL